MFDIAPLDIYDPDYGAELSNKQVYEDSNTKQRQIGIYVQEQAKLFDKLVIVLGGRYDMARSEFDDHSDFGDIHNRTTDEAFTGRAGLVYLFDNGLAPYFSYSESFEPVLETDADGNPFKPEEGRQYEVGIKYQPEGIEQLRHAVAVRPGEEERADAATRRTRSTARCRPARSARAAWNSKASRASTSGSTFRSPTPSSTPRSPRATSGEQGNKPGQTARHMASLWADYTIPGRRPRRLGLGAGVRYIGSSFGDNFEDSRRAGLHAGRRGHPLRMEQLQVRPERQQHLRQGYVASCFGETQCFYGERRTVLGTVTYRW